MGKPFYDAIVEAAVRLLHPQQPIDLPPGLGQAIRVWLVAPSPLWGKTLLHLEQAVDRLPDIRQPLVVVMCVVPAAVGWNAAEHFSKTVRFQEVEISVVRVTEDAATLQKEVFRSFFSQLLEAVLADCKRRRLGGTSAELRAQRIIALCCNAAAVRDPVLPSPDIHTARDKRNGNGLSRAAISQNRSPLGMLLPRPDVDRLVAVRRKTGLAVVEADWLPGILVPVVLLEQLFSTNRVVRIGRQRRQNKPARQHQSGDQKQSQSVHSRWRLRKKATLESEVHLDVLAMRRLLGWGRIPAIAEAATISYRTMRNVPYAMGSGN